MKDSVRPYEQALLHYTPQEGLSSTPEIVGEKVPLSVPNEEQPPVARTLHPGGVQHIALAAALKAPQSAPRLQIKGARMPACCYLQSHEALYNALKDAHIKRQRMSCISKQE